MAHLGQFGSDGISRIQGIGAGRLPDGQTGEGMWLKEILAS